MHTNNQARTQTIDKVRHAGFNALARLPGMRHCADGVGEKGCERMHTEDWSAHVAQVSAYNAAVASCERLLKQPIPVAYTRHTSRCATLLVVPYNLAFQHQVKFRAGYEFGMTVRARLNVLYRNHTRKIVGRCRV